AGGETPPVSDLLAVFERVGAAVSQFVAEPRYEAWQVLRPRLIAAGGLAVTILDDQEDFDEARLVLAHLRRAARRVENTVPPWELWFTTLDFYVKRLKASSDLEGDLGALCGLLIEAIWRLIDLDWSESATSA